MPLRERSCLSHIVLMGLLTEHWCRNIYDEKQINARNLSALLNVWVCVLDFHIIIARHKKNDPVVYTDWCFMLIGTECCEQWIYHNDRGHYFFPRSVWNLLQYFVIDWSTFEAKIVVEGWYIRNCFPLRSLLFFFFKILFSMPRISSRLIFEEGDSSTRRERRRITKLVWRKICGYL